WCALGGRAPRSTCSGLSGTGAKSSKSSWGGWTDGARDPVGGVWGRSGGHSDGSRDPVGGVWGRSGRRSPPDQIDAAEARARSLALRRRRRAPLARRGDGLLGQRHRRGRSLPRRLFLPQEAALLGAARRRGPLARSPFGLSAPRAVRAPAPPP